MSNRPSFAGALVAGLLLGAPVASASESTVPTIEELLAAHEEEPAAITRSSRASVDRGDSWLFTVSAGAFAALDEESNGTLGIEVRAPVWKFLRPIAGGTVVGDGSMFAYAGLRYDWRITDRLAIGPSVAAGAYFPGDRHDLGNTLQFRSAIDASYRIAHHSRIAVEFYHVSNAGLADTNPGAESLTIRYTFSLGTGD